MSVISSFVYGASISQHTDGFSSYSKQQEMGTQIHTITDLATEFLNEIPSNIYKGFDKLKFISDTFSSNIILNQEDTPLINEVSTAKPGQQVEERMHHQKDSATVTVSSSAFNLATNESHISKNGSHNSTLINPPITSFEMDGASYAECEETGANFCTWKILKIVGAAVGAGFIISLFSPVLFYFTITTLGCFCCGMYIDRASSFAIRQIT